MQQLGPSGKKLTLEAIRHRDEFRFRCRCCDTEFCCACMKMPYHLGFTCDQYNKYLTSRRCRFCKSQIQSAPPVSFPSISISINGNGNGGNAYWRSGLNLRFAESTATTSQVFIVLIACESKMVWHFHASTAKFSVAAPASESEIVTMSDGFQGQFLSTGAQLLHRREKRQSIITKGG